MDDVDVHHRNRDVGFGFLRNVYIADRTGDQQQQHEGNDRPRPVGKGFNQRVHRSSLLRWLTGSLASLSGRR